jgi:small subunit ribosomal protein S9
MPKKTKDYTFAVARRREAVARVRLFKGSSENTVNGELVGKYFPGKVMTMQWQKPFEEAGVVGKFYFSAKVAGGGKEGQLTALAHGISKALVALNSEKFRSSLKKAGLLTRDSRIRERRMVGTGGRARKQKQSPKR